MQSRILAIIQARMSSRRLPGKVLLDIAGQPMLVRVVERVQRAETVDEVVVATTSDPSDNAVEALCKGLPLRYQMGRWSWQRPLRLQSPPAGRALRRAPAWAARQCPAKLSPVSGGRTYGLE